MNTNDMEYSLFNMILIVISIALRMWNTAKNNPTLREHDLLKEPLRSISRQDWTASAQFNRQYGK